MPIAYSYIRFSTPEQLKGDSLRRQTELSEAYAEKHGLQLDTTLKLQDLGLSAFDRSNVEKGALGAFLKAIEQGRIKPGSFLIVESLDRLSRAQVTDALEVFLSIIRKGITIVTLNDGYEYSTQTMRENSYKLLISITIMQRAFEESETKAKRLRAAWINKANNANVRKITARCGGWMKLSDDRSKFEFIPGRVEIVREIIQMSLDGMGQSVIAKRLNDRGVVSWNGANGWHTSTLAKILNNPALYGAFQPHIKTDGKLLPHGDPVKDYFPALMTEEQFLILKKTRSERLFAGTGRRRNHVPNLLSGIAVCGYCGGSMVLMGNTTLVNKPDGSTERINKKSLVCDNGRRGFKCWALRWRYEHFETSFLTSCRLIDLNLMLNEVEAGTSLQSDIERLNDQITLQTSKLDDLGKKVTNIIEAIEEGLASQTLKDRLQSIEQEISAGLDQKAILEKQLTDATFTSKTADQNIETMKEAIDRISQLEGEELFVFRSKLAEAIRKTIKQVRLFPVGRLTPAEDIEELRKSLAEAGYGEKRINDYLASRRSEPSKARGRYLEDKYAGRNFVIYGRSGGLRAVSPDYDNPSEITFEMAVSPNYDDPDKTIYELKMPAKEKRVAG